MATIKLAIDKRRIYSDGRRPIIFRLSLHRRNTSTDSGIKLFEKDWDDVKERVTKTHENYESINLTLKKRVLDLEKKLVEMGSAVDEVNVTELRDILFSKKENRRTTFHEFATKEIQALKDQERYGNAEAYEHSVNRLLKFTGKNILIDQITYSVLEDFDLSLIKAGLCRNSISVYMREIRALFNKAIKRGLVDRSKYPFYDYKIRTEKTVSRAILKSELEKMRELKLEEGSKLWDSRNIFFLIFNLIGISFIDLALLTTDNIQNGRIVYKRRKTGKIYSIKITEEAEKIFRLYRDEKSKYLIWWFRLDNVPKEKIREEAHLRMTFCNNHLKKLGKLCKCSIPITTYVARYSWTNIAKTAGYSKDLIAEAMGHEYGNRITGIYLDNYGDEVIDEMNKKVCTFKTELLQTVEAEVM